MGAVAAVRILHRRQLAAAPEAQRSHLEAQLAAEHQRDIGGIDRAVALGVVDEVIPPRETRLKLAQAIKQTPALRGRHANIPL
jgi:acetyl-CoA/propionyl-CoA carboxylase carboxyl transferase subunit